MSPSHPLGNLTVQDGDLWEVYPGPPVKRTRYMAASTIRIAEKTRMKNLGDNKCSYTFRLSEPPDQVWVILLSANFPSIHAVPGAPTIVFECPAPDLSSRYEQLKSAVAKTNNDYQAERARLISETQVQDTTKTAAASTDVAQRKSAQEGFDSLKI